MPQQVQTERVSDQENKSWSPQPPPPSDDELLVIYLPQWESAYDRVKKAKG